MWAPTTENNDFSHVDAPVVNVAGTTEPALEYRVLRLRQFRGHPLDLHHN